MYKLADERDGKRKKVQSNIVCKFFLEAIKKKIYGIKWDCPNGDECHYRHSLPRDYILKSKQQEQEDMTYEEYVNLEEQIDEERTRISQTGMPVTDQNYEMWRSARDERRKLLKTEKEREAAKKLTGLQLFKNSQTNNQIIEDDEGAADDLKRQEGDGEDINNDIENDNFFKKDEEDEINKKLKGVKVTAELFDGDVRILPK